VVSSALRSLGRLLYASCWQRLDKQQRFETYRKLYLYAATELHRRRPILK
jgi:hypothetical protein